MPSLRLIEINFKFLFLLYKHILWLNYLSGDHMITHCSPDDVPLHVAQIYPKPIARVLYEHPENSSASQSRKIPSISNLVFYVPFRFLNIFTCRGLRRASPNIAFLGDNLDYGSL